MEKTEQTQLPMDNKPKLELKERVGMGLIKQDGQKYYLTEVGNLFLGSH